MALLTCIRPTAAGAVCTGVAVTSSDTISGGDAAAGAVLIVTVGGTPTTVTIVDAGTTPAGSAAAAGAGVTVAANTSKCFGQLSNYVSSSTSVLTVNYSSTTGATAMLVA